MACDQTLAARIRDILIELGPFEERKMFGGLAFMVSGRMCCGVLADDLIVKVGKNRGAELLSSSAHVRPFDFTGRPMTGIVYVSPAGTTDDAALREWVTQGADFAAAEPAKPARRPRR
jgi:TfoX/Sxy family transcriptional regulator of competence genes